VADIDYDDVLERELSLNVSVGLALVAVVAHVRMHSDFVGKTVVASAVVDAFHSCSVGMFAASHSCFVDMCAVAVAVVLRCYHHSISRCYVAHVLAQVDCVLDLDHVDEERLEPRGYDFVLAFVGCVPAVVVE